MNAADLDVKQVLQSPVDCLGQMLLAASIDIGYLQFHHQLVFETLLRLKFVNNELLLFNI